MTKAICAAALLLFSLGARAGGVLVGDGGIGIRCPGQAPQILDFFEARMYLGIHPVMDERTVLERIKSDGLDLLLPRFADVLDHVRSTMKAQVRLPQSGDYFSLDPSDWGPQTDGCVLFQRG